MRDSVCADHCRDVATAACFRASSSSAGCRSLPLIILPRRRSSLMCYPRFTAQDLKKWAPVPPNQLNFLCVGDHQQADLAAAQLDCPLPPPPAPRPA
uniref:Uncharacterized protein n=1 Tax=Arundo donax TaxID=35708 RepID=A0A0A9GHQ4_ARUDO